MKNRVILYLSFLFMVIMDIAIANSYIQKAEDAYEAYLNGDEK